MLQGKTKEFNNGYKACKQELESFLHESIVRNGGVHNGTQALHVLDDLALYLHMLNVKFVKEQRVPQTTVYMIVDTHTIH